MEEGLKELLKQELCKGLTIGDLRDYFYEQERKQVKEMIKKWLSWEEKEKDLFSMEEVKTFESIIEMNSMEEINNAFDLLDHENLEKKIDSYRKKKKEEEFYGVTLQEFQHMIKTLLCQPKKEEFFSSEDIKKLEDVQKMGSLSEISKILTLHDLDILNEKMLSHGMQDTKIDKLVRFNEEQMEDQHESKMEIKELDNNLPLQGILLKTVEKTEMSVKLQKFLNEETKYLEDIQKIGYLSDISKMKKDIDALNDTLNNTLLSLQDTRTKMISLQDTKTKMDKLEMVLKTLESVKLQELIIEEINKSTRSILQVAKRCGSRESTIQKNS